ncbi:fungal-specific transcription factor domain-containing protein [Aspergillus pseudonomiae]|uniref:Fungal-specific transcription factor domain-containing protein n=1 Tax=Aspergillus pseudonomiae TaxID=1506151 RepID=A0A5N7CTK8_9EURO|nr:fungal-specific transcription factor domain-containing protein [Aspergillus pseudonomiae]KAB8253796.1 fungal-specific transcription factor domain-containing protein [Aspergillus pseudonomiae]KAE8397502.1 fungal-specific transcription factor domain-containing protein [Aspergillus pseudonomiae]
MPVKYPRQTVRLPYPRSRSGCLVCRRLHKKCDERRPECTRCVLKGKLCQWPGASGQREPDPGDAPPTPPTPDLISHPSSHNPRRENASSPVPIFRHGGGRSGPRDEVPRLITLPSCPSMGSVSSMFLAYFVAETSRFMTTVGPEKNPFLTHLLPLAFSDELILYSLLALGGAHLERRQSSPEIKTWVCRHYGQVICLLQGAISRKSNEPLDWLRALLAQIILYLVGVFGSAQDEGAMMHIRAGRKVARRLLSASSKTSDLRVLCGFTFELYTYLALIASPTPYNNGTESELDTRSSLLLSWDILKNYATFGLIVSPIYQSLDIIPRVISLCIRRQAEIMFDEHSSESWAEFVELMTLIETVGSSGSGSADDPHPATSPEEHEQSLTIAAIYRHALAIFAYDAMWCGTIVGDESRLAAVREHALSALMLMPTLMDTPLRNVLLWPTIVIGSCLVNEAEWDVIRNISSIREPISVVIKMKSMLEDLWSANDPALFGPYGLHKHMVSHQTTIYLA